MTEKEYRNHSAISRSELWKIKESPEKFRYYKDNPIKSTPALIFGQAVHKIILENDKFFDEFAVLPHDIDRRTKAGREEYNNFISGNITKTIISEDDFLIATEIMRSVDNCEFCTKLLNGKKELPLFWVDELTGEECKCRFDCITKIGGQNIIVDLKTCASADTETFMKEAIKYGYHVQAAMYSEGAKHNGYENPEFVFIAVEKAPPYAVNIIQASEIFKRYGFDEYRNLLGIYHECKESGNWYGYLGKENEINFVGLPAWIAKDYDDKENE